MIPISDIKQNKRINELKQYFEEKSFLKDWIQKMEFQEQKEVIVHRGNEATFFVHVQYRQNSSWQGQVEWAEKGVLKHFNSELDLVKLISGAIE